MTPVRDRTLDRIRFTNIHIDAEDLAKDAWFATVDKITVTKR